ncbi:MAG: DEAD/DEAH box helicase [Candidatus Njordarchaeia archaeon]
MPVQVVKIGEKAVQSSELSWEDILKTAKILKKIAKWDADNKVWQVDWKLFASLNDFLSEAEKILKPIDEGYYNMLRETIRDVVSKIDKFIDGSPFMKFLIVNCDPFKVYREIKQLGGYMKIEEIAIESFGNVQAPFLYVPKRSISGFLELIEKVGLKDCFDIPKNGIKIEKKVSIAPYGEKYIEIAISKPVDFELIEKLKDIAKIEYFSSSLREGLVKKETTFFKRAVHRDREIIRLPNYTLRHVLDLVTRYYKNIDIDPQLTKETKLDFEMKKNFELYQYQNEALESWKQNKYWGTIVIPTGGGKTFIGLEAIYRLKVPTIILVPNIWLLYQWVDRISKNLNIPKTRIGILGGGEKKINEITVATYQSGYKQIENLARRFSLVIFDEAHHVPANTFKKVALYIMATHRMALSATPKRADHNEILLFKLAGKIIFKISYPALVKMGIVAPLVIRKILVPMPKERVAEYNKVRRKLNYAWDELEKKQILNKLIEIARDNPLKINIIKHLVQKHKDEKMFIFAGSISFAEQILKAIKPIIPSALLTAKTKKSEEKKIIRGFINGVYRALILVKKGEEGVDIGDASVAIIAGGSKQEREIIQRIGRILRGGKEKLAWVYEIVTERSIEEQLSKARRTESLVKNLDSYIREKYNVEAFKIIKWNELERLLG